MSSESETNHAQTNVDYQGEVQKLLASRNGHFLLESGHHGELWLDLELLCLRPKKIQPLARELAGRLEGLEIDAICGPLNEGAFVALAVAAQLDVDFIYTERFANPSQGSLYPCEYRVPRALRGTIRGRRVAIVNDVINAGSAVRGTFADLEACHAKIVAIAPLLVLGSWTAGFVAQKKVALHTLASLPNRVWLPDACPLCDSGVPLDNVAASP